MEKTRGAGEEEVPFCKKVASAPALRYIIIVDFVGYAMKKIIFAVAAFFSLATAAFAADDVSKGSFSIGFSFPQVYNLRPADKDIDSERYSGFGINFALRGVVGLPFGLYVDGNLYFPYAHKIKMGDVEYRYDLSDVRVVGIEGQLGVYSVLLNTGRFALPFGGGLHLNYQDTSYKSVSVGQPDSQSVFSVGFGGWINAELQVTEKFTLYGGLRLDYDFWQRQKTETKVSANGTRVSTESGMSSMLFVIPVLGVIIRF